jgi:protein SCO1
MNRAWVLVALLLAGCGEEPAVPPLAGARIGGPFTLVDETGKTVTDKDFAGQYRIVYFGYTFCPDVCPVDMRNLMLGLKAFEAKDAARAVKIAPIFITTDPERDTPPVLTDFTNAFHPRLIGLGGTPDQIKTAMKTFAVYAMKGDIRPDGGYLVDHSRVALLMGPKGEPIAMLPHDGTPDEIAADLDRFVT